MFRIGYHVSIAKSLDLAFDRARLLGCTAMQLFVSNPRSWAVGMPERVERESFIEKDGSFGIIPVAHMPYLPNLASSNPKIYRESVRSLELNLLNCNALGIKYLVAHLGSHMGHGSRKGIGNVVDALEEVSERLGSVMILLENEAGHRNSIGARLEELAAIYDGSSLSRKKRLGFCLDTCHLFAAGYDLRKRSTLDEIDGSLGFDKVHVIHANDAKFELGSGKDRHDNIGFGHIGRKGFENMLSYPRMRGKIFILETPANDELAPDYEIRLMKELYSLTKE